ncbi:MAG: RNA-binding protein [Cocleimonas sp.]|nr:RNA-binding protein [Cocleimonas sp.]
MATNRRKKQKPNIKPELTELRLDKWLWAARIFKTRTVAVEAINGGKVHLNGIRIKPSRTVHIGDQLNVTRGVDRYHITIQGINDKRRPAKEAQLLYIETEESIQKREQQHAMRKIQNASRIRSDKKPNKQQRRKIIRFKSAG